MNKAKILILIPSLYGGGAERILINLLNLISKDRFEITLVQGIPGEILEKKVPKQVKLISLYPSLLWSQITNNLFIRFGIALPMKIFGQKIRGRFDFAISFLDSAFSEYLFYNSAQLKRRAVVIHSSYRSHQQMRQFIKGKHYLRLSKRYKKVDTIVSVSHEALKEFRELFGNFDDMRVIYNPINKREVLEKAQAESIPALEQNKNVLNFLAVGSLIPVKGYERLLEACRILENEYKGQFALNILGEGVLRSELEDKISSLELASVVKLRGFQENPYPWMLQSDVFIMGTYAEGLPTVLCEAILLHKATLVPDVPGCRELVGYNGEYGLLTKNDTASIAAGMKRYLDEPTLITHYERMSQKRASIFDDQSAIDQYESLFLNR